ncbi:MAG: hypothetical protein Q7R83_04335 [bacterium]|nr:hypothetical protein [bacterium]
MPDDSQTPSPRAPAKTRDPSPPFIGSSLDLTGLTGGATGAGWTVAGFDAGKKSVTVTRPDGDNVRTEIISLDTAARIGGSRYNVANKKAPKPSKRLVTIMATKKRFDFPNGDAQVLGMDGPNRRYLVQGSYNGQSFQKWVSVDAIDSLELNQASGTLITDLGFQPVSQPKESKKKSAEENTQTTKPLAAAPVGQSTVADDEEPEATQSDDDEAEAAAEAGTTPSADTTATPTVSGVSIDAVAPPSITAALSGLRAQRATTATGSSAASTIGGTAATVGGSATSGGGSARMAGGAAGASVNISLPTNIAPLVAQANALLNQYAGQIQQIADKTNKAINQLKSVSQQIDKTRAMANQGRIPPAQAKSTTQNLVQRQRELRDDLTKIPSQKGEKVGQQQALQQAVERVQADPSSSEAVDELSSLLASLGADTISPPVSESIQRTQQTQPKATPGVRMGIPSPPSVGSAPVSDSPSVDAITKRPPRPLGESFNRFQSAQQRDRTSASQSGYEGVSDSYQDALANEGGSNRSVLPTIPQTYGAAGEQKSFAARQQEMNETQENFLAAGSGEDEDGATSESEGDAEGSSPSDADASGAEPGEPEDAVAADQRRARAFAMAQAADAQQQAATQAAEATDAAAQASAANKKKKASVLKQLWRVNSFMFSFGATGYEYLIAILNDKMLHIKPLEKKYPPPGRIECLTVCCICFMGCLMGILSLAITVALILAPWSTKIKWVWNAWFGS